MQDAESGDPLVWDNFARRFMNEDGLRIFEDFAMDANANASTVARVHIIDEMLRREIAADAGVTIVLIGAGFDSRAYRLGGGNWVELDEPQVIEYKNERLPLAECPDPLQRIAIDFGVESLADKLFPFSGEGRFVVVIEGVFMYLDEAVIAQMLETIRGAFPQHKLICDLMSREFFEKYTKDAHDKIAALGASFKFTIDRPQEFFITRGYTLNEKVSTAEAAVKHGSLKMPMLLLKTVFRSLLDGYAIYEFETGREIG